MKFTIALLLSLLVSTLSQAQNIYDLAVGMAAGQIIAKGDMVTLDLAAPKCIVRGSDGASLKLKATKDGETVIPRGAIFSGDCFVAAKERK